MTSLALAFMIGSWCFVLGLTAWCFRRVLGSARASRRTTEPDAEQDAERRP